MPAPRSTPASPTPPSGAATGRPARGAGEPLFPASRPSPPVWCDSHCHIPYQGLGPEAIADAAAAGVTRLVTVGTDAEQSEAGLALAAAHEGVGHGRVAPHDASKAWHLGATTAGSARAGGDRRVRARLPL